MAREFKGKLSKDDVTWLKARYSEAYVERMISLHGTKGGDDTAEADAKAAEEAEKARLAAEEAAKAESTGQGGDGGEEEDLIGSTFDVLDSTEAEVKAWAESASDEDKAAALSTEQGRTDREPRKGVVSLLS